ncbi:short chain dehydrogenase [Paeniglutamicibacter gangotriensis]|uniref:Short chain dehydrogenase n=2 Tax=Paeniglutamicibacter gangotriensis TaxID=254787 RepID=A0A5B0EMR7_9MICC|nr:short chain dehydrogenase [Paeniglutamicibacter gangotriensis]
MKILIVGSSGTVGKAVTSRLGSDHTVIEASRSTNPPVDLNSDESIHELFQSIGTVDAIVACTGVAPFKPLRDLAGSDYQDAFNDKVMGQIRLVNIGRDYLNAGGSFTLTTGILAREPILTGAAASLANGALESWVPAAATELDRGHRINAVSATVLAEATGYHAFFPGFVPVAAAYVAAAYAKSVEGTHTGKVYKVEG